MGIWLGEWVLTNGEELDADAIVMATGYGSMNGWAGELRNMWKSTQQEALWFQGGNLHQKDPLQFYPILIPDLYPKPPTHLPQQSPESQK